MTDLIDLQRQIADLQKKANEVKAKEMASTIADIKQKMAAFGITVKDLQATKTKRKPGSKPEKAVKADTKKPKKVAPVKFRGPNGETWSGRGLMPKWMKALTEAGQKKESFKIPDAS